MFSRHLCLLRFTYAGSVNTGPSRLTVREFRKSCQAFARGQNSKPSQSLHPFEAATGGGHSSSRSLWKPFIFTVAFSSCSFVGASLWQYENVRDRAIRIAKRPFGWIEEKFYGSIKQGSWRREINAWWNGLTEGQRLFYPICLANCFVFLAWRVPSFQTTMVKYFCSNPCSRVLCWPMLLSTFSHYSALHLVANMYVLHSFSTGAVASLGKEQFLGFYLSAGVISSFTSYLHKVSIASNSLSLGASGAIMAILGYVCTVHPDTKLGIIFLPMYSFSADTAIKVIVALDAIGVIMGWRFFDHAAHLGGALFGISWALWGNEYVWKKREPLVRWWHEIRGTPTE
ncbi:presenilins-associated rhomboid-like protein, mitochondrial [Ischnura elegans]|uniref:presenilins-associated rhomboid-like protein, mitochondrial n=1 Tax=Ischnura elegans TaxID=197161 RepID=UPI001ED8AEDE|nr:presenilins-associated rhomboid-like protein, mitochondrial [Ischnura elegans]